MRTPPRLLVVAVTIPFMAGCFAVLPSELPQPNDRNGTDIRGVVVENGGEGEWIEFEEIYNVDWTDRAVFIVGSLVEEEGQPPVDVTREFRYNELSGVLQRQVDAAKTSIIVGGVLVGAIAALTFVFNSQANEGVVLPGS